MIAPVPRPRQTERQGMRRQFTAGVLMAAAIFATALAAPSARADEWTKTYPISGRADLRVETDDGDVSIVSADQKQIDARVSADGYKIGESSVRIEESQNGDHVTLRVRLPQFNFHWWGGRSRAVRIELRVPRELDLDVHTGDGNVTAQPFPGRIRIDTGDGNVNANGLKGELTMHSGDGRIEAAGLDGTLEVNTGDGNISVD